MASLLVRLPLIPMLHQYIILLLLIQIPPYLSSYDYYKNCTNQISCGNIRNIGFPFWGDNRPNWCGHPSLHLICVKNISYINIHDVQYQVLEANPNENTLKITRVDYFHWLEICPSKLVNTSLDTGLFVYGSENKNLTLFYGCTASNSGLLPCNQNGAIDYVYPQFGFFPPPVFCKACVVVPVSPSLVDISDFANIQKAIKDGFMVRWIAGIEECEKCVKSNGTCGYDTKSYQPTCSNSSPDANALPQSQEPPPGSSSKWNRRLTIGIGASAAGFGVVLAFLMIICFHKRRLCFGKRRIFMKRRKLVDNSVEVFMQSYGSLTPKRYSYPEVKRITNTFVNKLGQGGYGVVYKATLPDGRPVAVKVISETKGNGEEFINEVASISRTSHVNIVSLLGFCYEMEKRALIYEFMPNGSLDNFIYKSGYPNAICNFDWHTLYQIGIGIARGLEYLHRGCNTRILHLDVKPQNILLDEDFCPKISDFGLAKICQKKESIVSILGTRGTIGYIAPEVFSRTFGGVSHKSDVYSYGMLILEMIGARKNHDSGGSHTSEMYFPDWIYKDLEQDDIPSSCLVTTEEENEKVRKMTLVSLWCVQINPSDRPSMSKVAEMLEGALESVPYPPKPVLYSPAGPPLQISDTSSSNMQDTNSITTQKGASIN